MRVGHTLLYILLLYSSELLTSKYNLFKNHIFIIKFQALDLGVQRKIEVIR